MQWRHASQRRTKGVCLAGFVGLLVLCLSVGTGHAQQEEVIAAGKQVYVKYCANCHGQEARGGGSVAKLFTLRSVDLRELAKRNSDVFPFWEVYRVIDGRTEIKAHVHARCRCGE